MSLIQNQNQISQHLIDEHDQYITSSSRCIQFEIQAALIPDQYRFEYESARKLAKIVEGFVDSKSVEEYFVYFHGISDTEYEVIEKALRRAAVRGRVRFTFEAALDAAILRISPGNEHSLVSCNFDTRLMRKMTSIPGHDWDSVMGLRAALFQDVGVRSKEGDQSYRPHTRRGGGEAWPSVMMEVGYSGGIDFLRLDAEWWLVHSQGQTRFVIIGKVERDPFTLHFECWMMVESGRRETRRTPNRIPRRVQDFDIDEAGVVVSTLGCTELEIPYDCIFDGPGPDPPLPPVTFSFAELSDFGVWMFRFL